MKLNKVFQTAEVPIPDRSGFDLSKEHLFTAPVGTIVPAECFEVIPNDTVSMGNMMKVTLPPFAVPFMGRIDAVLEAFFVPYRILWSGWQSFITQNMATQYTGTPNNYQPVQVPVIDTTASANAPYLGAGSLADYLGYAQSGSLTPIGTLNISAMKFLAYHMICDHWYRDPNNMKPFFAKNPYPFNSIGLEHTINSFMNVTTAAGVSAPTLSLAPGTSTAVQVDNLTGLGMLRQRCWAKDYFTTATTRPQAGDSAQVTFSTSGSTGNFTVSDLRVANALQKWLERNNLAGTDYGSQILAHFGVTPPDSVLDKPLLLGQIRESVYVGGVENNSNAAATSTDNPFGSTLGSAAGFASGMGKGSLIPEFHVKEHGCIMVMFSLVPHAYYNTGVEKELLHLNVGNFAWPEYAKIGDQEIQAIELAPNAINTNIFGYNQRYSEYKCRLDKISGLLRDGQSLDVYALQRGFTSAPSIGSSFLTIPQNYLDQCSQTNYEVSNFGCMVDAFFDTRAIRLLPSYSLPSL